MFGSSFYVLLFLSAVKIVRFYADAIHIAKHTSSQPPVINMNNA